MHKKVISAMLCMLFVGVELMVLLPVLSQKANAADITSVPAGKNHELVYNLIEVCSGGGRLKRQQVNKLATADVRFAGSISQVRATKGEIFNIYDDPVSKVYTGEYNVKLSWIHDDNDFQRECQKTTKAAGAALYGDYDTFLETFYTDSGGEWVRKSTYKDNNSAITGELRRKAKEKDYYETKSGGLYPRETLAYRYMVLRKPFTECFEKNTRFTQFTDPSGTTWAYKAEQDNAKKQVGPIMDRGSSQGGTFNGDNDGTWECSEFRKNIVANKNYFREVFLSKDERVELKTGETREEKINLISDLFAANPTPLNNCLAFFGANYSSLPKSTLNQITAVWLADGGKGSLKLARRTGDVTIVEASKANDFAACLVSDGQYGSALQEKLDITPEETNTPEGGSTEEKPSCESEGGTLSWIICPVLFLGDKIMQSLDELVTNLLKLPNSYLEEPGLETAWKRIRDMAYIVLIPAMLVMVISTALGFEFVSAYTVKKALPRMFIAIIFIALSFSLCKYLVIFTNNIGNGVQGLITGAFTGSSEIKIADLFNPDAGDSVVAGGAVALGGIGILAAGSIGIIISYVFVAIIGLLIGFTLLAFRQVLILALLLLAPLAIIAWIFPGNDKMWKLWWGTFSKLLLLFPLIMLAIGAGKAFASIVPDDAGLIGTLIKLIAYIGPFFLIPSLFKFAGGVFATVSGMANDKGKGLFDRQKKYRAEKAHKNLTDWKAGEKAWRPKSFNKLGERTSVGLKGGFGFGARGQTAIKTQRRENAAERAAKDESLKQLGLASDEGNAVMALSGGTNAGAEQAANELRNSWLEDDNAFVAARASGDQATMQARMAHHQNRADEALREAKAVGINRSRAQAAGSIMMQNKARAIVGGADGRKLLQNGFERLHGDNPGAADETRQAMAFFARGSGRADLGSPQAVGGTTNERGAIIDGFDRAGASAVAHGHVSGVRETSAALVDEYHEALVSGDEDRSIEAASKLTSLRNAMTQQTPEENKAAINEALATAGIDLGSGTSTDDQFGELIAPGSGATTVTNRIRNRAGLWDQSRGGVPPPQGGGPPGGGTPGGPSPQS